MISHFDNEGDKFRAFMAANPQAVVVVRYGADGSCDVEDDPENLRNVIDGEAVQE